MSQLVIVSGRDYPARLGASAVELHARLRDALWPLGAVVLVALGWFYKVTR